MGADGKDGNGISKVTLTEDFYLVFNYTDGTSSDKIGPIKGKDGANGADGLTPILTLDNESGDLSVKYGESGTVTLLGNIKGIKGDKGDKGIDGKSAYELYIAAHPEYTGTQEEWLAALKGEKGDTGRGIEKTEIVNGELIITYSDGTVDRFNISSQCDNSCFVFNRLDDGTLEVSINPNYKTLVENISVPAEFYGLKVSKIAESGFSDCPYLKKITIPASLKTISDYSFRNCGALLEINIPDSVTSIGNSCFYNCRSLASVNISNSVTSIGDNCFYNCISLTSVNIPNTVTSLGSGVFYGCSALKSVNLPIELKSLGSSMFSGCESLSEIKLPDTLITIGIYAFEKCSALKEITIPYNTKEIGMRAFRNSGIEKAYFENTSGWARYYTTTNSGDFWNDNVTISKLLPDEAAKLLKETWSSSSGSGEAKWGFFWKRS